MFFAWDITVSANTAEASPKTQILKLSKGVITRADIKFPSGCHGMVKVRLFRWEAQLVPLSRDEWVTGDGETVKTEAYYELVEMPYQLKFVGASPGTNYDHTITVRVTVLPKAVATFMPLVNILTKFFKRIGVIR
ncbi:MAG: hypothetical protein JRE40_01700 [Deltaproteobacteria bacterium]|nr:hypothetical protein [Deltaproteobacteria bacterium]MBW2672515.1 hypothetical protein [Deltaproteobacteria bacterium]